MCHHCDPVELGRWGVVHGKYGVTLQRYRAKNAAKEHAKNSNKRFDVFECGVVDFSGKSFVPISMQVAWIRLKYWMEGDIPSEYLWPVFLGICTFVVAASSLIRAWLA